MKYVSFDLLDLHGPKMALVEHRGDVASIILPAPTDRTTSPMLRSCTLHICGKVLSSNTYPSTINTMMFSRNTLLAAAAAFYGASSVSAFAPSTGEYLVS